LPREDTTPPVTKTNLVMSWPEVEFRFGRKLGLYGRWDAQNRKRTPVRRVRKDFAEDAEGDRNANQDFAF
jgi:hypothetical protein